MEDRTSLLQRVVRYELPLADTIVMLRAYGWDADHELVTLTADDVLRLLKRYVSGELSAQQVEHWAELLEMRGDLGYEKRWSEELRKVLLLLANPEEHDAITPRLAIQLCRTLTEAAA